MASGRRPQRRRRSFDRSREKGHHGTSHGRVPRRRRQGRRRVDAFRRPPMRRRDRPDVRPGFRPPHRRGLRRPPRPPPSSVPTTASASRSTPSAAGPSARGPRSPCPSPPGSPGAASRRRTSSSGTGRPASSATPATRRAPAGAGVRIFGTDADGVGYGPDLVAHLGVGSLFSRIQAGYVTASISLAILKDHGLAGVTAGMKNYFGAIHNPNKYHDSGCDPVRRRGLRRAAGQGPPPADRPRRHDRPVPPGPLLPRRAGRRGSAASSSASTPWPSTASAGGSSSGSGPAPACRRSRRKDGRPKYLATAERMGLGRSDPARSSVDRGGGRREQAGLPPRHRRGRSWPWGRLAALCAAPGRHGDGDRIFPGSKPVTT